jgi:hypothetical protein
MKSNNSEASETKPSYLPPVFWPFSKTDPKLLEAIHKATMTKHRTDNHNSLGDALL